MKNQSPNSSGPTGAASGAPPSSSRRIAASRANGRRSGGPATPEGKARSAANSLKHGLTAETVVLGNEDPSQYRALRASYFAYFEPRGPVEIDLVDAMVASKWRHRRLLGMESAVFDLELDGQRENLAREFSDISEDIRTALAFRADVSSQGSLPILYRHEARLSREYVRLLRTLFELRSLCPPGDAGPAPEIAPAPKPEFQNEPSPISGHSPDRLPARFSRISLRQTAA